METIRHTERLDRRARGVTESVTLATGGKEGGRRTRGGQKRSDALKPLVSIITVVYNGADQIEETIRAVLSQTYPNIEYIVIDGGSTDATVDILRRYDEEIDYWLSEPDQGLYYAMNKGVGLVTDPEAYVVFANADDRLASSTVVAEMVERGKGADLIHGRELLGDDEVSTIAGGDVSLNDLAHQNFCHPATFTRRRLFDTVGPFDTRYRVVADYDFIVRCFEFPVSVRFVDTIVAEVRMFGLSETRFLQSCTERADVVRRRFRGFDRLTGVGQIYLYDIPRNFVRYVLRRTRLLQHWRSVRSS
jgi:glycosyltransferase involved in cell wall biosynthesis